MSDPQTTAQPDQPRGAIALTFDRLPLRLLGAYGSSLCQTPHLDRLAAQSCVFDNHFAEDLNESRNKHVWWSDDSPQGLTGRLQANDVRTLLVTDRPPADWNLAPSGFEIVHVVESAVESGTPDIRELLAAAESHLNELENSQTAWLLWIHSSEMAEIPVAKLEFLELYLDELTELPPETDEDDPQDRPLPEELRAEALEFISETLELLEQEEAELELRHLKVLNVLASAKVSELDHELGNFIQRLASSPQTRQALLLLSSDTGLALGEQVLTRDLDSAMSNCPLAEERVHVPLIVKPNEPPFSQRCAALTQHSDLPATLLDWFGIISEECSLLPLLAGGRETIRESSISIADDWRAIRTSSWLLVENKPEGIERLYRQPEDRHQVLDVLSQFIDIAEELEQKLQRVAGALSQER